MCLRVIGNGGLMKVFFLLYVGQWRCNRFEIESWLKVFYYMATYNGKKTDLKYFSLHSVVSASTAYTYFVYVTELS